MLNGLLFAQLLQYLVLQRQVAKRKFIIVGDRAKVVFHEILWALIPHLVLTDLEGKVEFFFSQRHLYFIFLHRQVYLGGSPKVEGLAFVQILVFVFILMFASNFVSSFVYTLD